MSLLDGIDGVTLCLQVMHGVECVLVILPFDGFFGTEGGLVDLGIRRAAAYAAEHDAFDAHGIGGAKDSTYVMLATNVIEYYDQRQFLRLAVLVEVHATHFGGG